MDMKRYIEILIEMARDKCVVLSQEEKEYFKKCSEQTMKGKV